MPIKKYKNWPSTIERKELAKIVMLKHLYLALNI